MSHYQGPPPPRDPWSAGPGPNDPYAAPPAQPSDPYFGSPYGDPYAQQGWDPRSQQDAWNQQAWQAQQQQQAWTAPPAAQQRGRGGSGAAVVGVLLVLLGAWFLFRDQVSFDLGEVWPMVAVGVGLLMILAAFIPRRSG